MCEPPSWTPAFAGDMALLSYRQPKNPSNAQHSVPICHSQNLNIDIVMRLIRIYIDLQFRDTHVHEHHNTDARPSPSDREGGSDTASPSSVPARRRLDRPARPRLGVRALKPVTYSLMHLTVAISVAYALTGDWRIALGVGMIEPMVQTVAYMLHEKAWSVGGKGTQAIVRRNANEVAAFDGDLSPTPRT